MKYEIYCEDTLIAKFLNEIDRDNYLDFLTDKYNDHKFEAKNLEEQLFPPLG